MSRTSSLAALLLVPLFAACGGGSGGSGARGGGVTDASLPQLLSVATLPGRMASAGGAQAPAISGDGAVVAFVDFSANAVPGDTNEASDILVFDAASGRAEHINVGPGGEQADSRSREPALDEDGSHCVFSSRATNLVPDDTNGQWDVFVRDLQAGTTRRVNVSSSGEQAAGGLSGAAQLSADGSIVVFSSSATNLVPNDTNNHTDVFVHDCVTGITTRVSVDSAGTQAVGGENWEPHVSADGRFVVFSSWATNLVPSDANGRSDVFLHDRTTGTTTRISETPTGGDSDGTSFGPYISADGSVVVFESFATNLVGAGVDTNLRPDVFAYDVATGVTSLVSRAASGLAANGASRDATTDAMGRYVVFTSFAPDLVLGDTNETDDVFRHDLMTGATERVNTRPDGSGVSAGWTAEPQCSHDGMRVVFVQGGPDLTPDGRGPAYEGNVFIKDLGTGALQLTSISATRTRSDGDSGRGEGSVTVSSNGRWVAFTSEASNLVAGDTNNLSDIFRRDMLTGETVRVLVQPPGARSTVIDSVRISDDGRFICFVSESEMWLPAGVDTNRFDDVFVYDVDQQVLERVSVHTDGTEGRMPSQRPEMSADGRFVVFESQAREIVDGKTQRNREIFLRDRQAGTTVRVVVNKDGQPTLNTCDEPDVSDDGRYVIFGSSAPDLVDGDTNGEDDIFVRDMQGGMRRVSVDSAGLESDGESWTPSLSDDGRYVAFVSDASNLVLDDTNGNNDIFRHDLLTGETLRVSLKDDGSESTSGSPQSAQISGDGQGILFATDDVDMVAAPLVDTGLDFLLFRNVAAETTRLVGLAPGGGLPSELPPDRGWSLTADGATLIYAYRAAGVVNVYRMATADGLE